MATTSPCPGCGAPLAFRPGTMVTVCRHCKSLSARTDRDPALVGRVAALADSQSPLKVGLQGRYAGRGFEVAGRVQLSHPLGGTWDEWYLAFDDGRWGWLAEAQGKVILTFAEALTELPPDLASLAAGQEVDLGDHGQWTVAERSEGTFAGAEGEIPWDVDPGKTYPFADLSGRNGAFATLDYGEDPPAFYSGREQRWEDLGLGKAEAGSRKVKALSLNCPHCGSPLSLRAPDQTLRVGCPSCGGLLACDQGKLTYLKSLQKPGPWMRLELGAEARFHGVPYTCIGAFLRSCKVEGLVYPWTEYLLMDPHGSFRWLVESDGHWSFVEPVPAGEVKPAGIANMAAAWKGETFRKFQEVTAEVNAVVGECYWKVTQGERAGIAEFVSAPRSLARETQSHPGQGEEINWSLSTYLQPAEVAEAFRLKDPLPEPQGIAPHMPNPHKSTLNNMVPWMVGAMVLLCLMMVATALRDREDLLYQDTINLVQRFPALYTPKPARPAAPTAPATPASSLESTDPVIFAGPIALTESTKNLSFTISAPVNNQWIGVEGALVNEQTGDVELFEATSSYYHGVDDGESWSEGSTRDQVLLSALPAGTYMLRLAPAWEGPQPPVGTLKVELRAGVMHTAYFVWAFILVLLWPLIQFFRVTGFEGRRWSESMYQPQSQGGDE